MEENKFEIIKLKISDSDHLKNLLLLKVTETINNGKTAYKNAKEIYEILITIEPSKHLNDPIKCFVNHARGVLKNIDINALPSAKAKAGISSLVGYLFNLGLVDADTLSNWLTKLNGDENKIVRLNLMHITKESIKKLMNDDVLDEHLMRIYKALKDEILYDEKDEDDDFMRNLPVTMQSRSALFTKHEQAFISLKVDTYKNSSGPLQIHFANELIDELISNSSTSCNMMYYNVKIFEQVYAFDRNFEKVFNKAMKERLKKIENPYSLCINLTCIELFRSELTSRPGAYVERLAERILFMDRGRTIIFIIVLHKMSTRLRREAPEVFDRCIGYLRQILDVDNLPPNEDIIEDELKSKIYHKQLESFNFRIDNFSLDRAKIIFMKTFEDRDYIARALSQMENNLAIRLLKIHLGKLCVMKFQTENLHFNIKNALDARNKVAQAVTGVISKFYEFNVISNETILEIIKILTETCNFSMKILFCLEIYAKSKEDHDLRFTSTRKMIMKIHQNYSGEEDESTSSCIDFQDFIRRLSMDECSIEAFNFEVLQNSDIKSLAIFLVTNSNDPKILEVTSKICEEIQKVQPEFKEILRNFLEESFTITLKLFGHEHFIQKFESKALLLGNLTKAKFIEFKLIHKFLTKSREILTETNSVEGWKSFLRVFTNIIDHTLWQSRPHDHDTYHDYLNILESFYDLIESNSIPSIVAELQETLKSFHDYLQPVVVNAANANPSFKRAVHSMINNYGVFSMSSMKFRSPIYVKNPVECAKYFIINAISCKEARSELVCFLGLLKSGSCGDSEELQELFKSETAKLLPEVNNYVLRLFDEQHLQRRGYDDEDKTVASATLLCLLLFYQLISYENWKKCVEMITDSIATEVNDINKECLKKIYNYGSGYLATEKNFDATLSYIYLVIDLKEPEDYEDVTDKLLTVEDFEDKSSEAQAKMIFENVLKQKDLTPKIIEYFSDLCVELLQKHSKFKEQLEKRIYYFTAHFVCAPYVKNFNWPTITKLGLFILKIKKLCSNPISFTDLLKVKFENCGEIDSRKSYVKFFIDIAKVNEEILRHEHVLCIDQISLYPLEDSDDELNKLVGELCEISDAILSLEDKNPKVSFSFKYFIDNVINKECNIHEWNISVIDNANENAKFFIKHALMRPYSRLKYLVKNLRTMHDGESHAMTKYSLKSLMPEITKECQSILDNMLCTKELIGITKLIAELHSNQFYPKLEFDSCIDKICERVMEKPTMCSIMCFYNLTENLSSEKINKTSNFIEQRIKKSDLEFTDDFLETIDCETFIEKVIDDKKLFEDFLQSLSTSEASPSSFDYTQLSSNNLLNYSTLIIKGSNTKEILENASEICGKIQTVYPEFKEVLMSQIKGYEEEGTEWCLTKLAAKFYNDDFFDWINPVVFLNGAKSNLQHFCEILIMIEEKLKKVDTANFLKFYDFLYSESKDLENPDKIVRDTLEGFYEKLKPSSLSFDGHVLPSFKYAIKEAMRREISIPEFQVGNVKDAAKYFILIVCKFFGLQQNLATFLRLLKSNNSNLPLIAEVLEETFENFKEVFCTEKLSEEGNKTINITNFATACCINEVLKVEEYVKMVEIVVDAMAIVPNSTLRNCLKNIQQTKTLLKDAEHEKLMAQLETQLSIFENINQKNFEVVEVGNEVLKFSDIKSKKDEVIAQMILDSVRKLENPTDEDFKTYLKYIDHIGKHRPVFVIHFEKCFNVKTLMLTMAPRIEKINWKEIKNFTKLLIKLEGKFKRSFLKDFLQSIANRIQNEKRLESWLELMKFYLETAKENRNLLISDNIWMLDSFFKCPLKNDDQFKAIYLRFMQVLYDTPPNDFQIFLETPPSFHLMMNQISHHNKTFHGSVYIHDVANEALTFVLSAASRSDFDRTHVDQLMVWKKMKASDCKFSKPITEKVFLDKVLQRAQELFDDYYIRNESHMKTYLYGLCFFISDLYTYQLIASSEFHDCCKKSAKAVKQRATQLRLQCYKVLVISTQNEYKRRSDVKMMDLFMENLYMIEKYQKEMNTNYTLDQAKQLDDENTLKSPQQKVEAKKEIEVKKGIKAKKVEESNVKKTKEVTYKDQAAGPSTSYRNDPKEVAKKIDRKAPKIMKLSDLLDPIYSGYFQFYKAESESCECNFDIENPKEFRKFIADIWAGEDVSKFECLKSLNMDLQHSYSLFIISKIQEHGFYARVMAEIVAKISAKNMHFPSVISNAGMNLFRHLVKNNRNINNFLEFFTMLNKFDACEIFASVIQSAFFELTTNKDCFKNNYGPIDEFVMINLEAIEKLPDYVQGDIFYYMKSYDASYEDLLCVFDPYYESLDPDQCQGGNPSFKKALNDALTNHPKDIVKKILDIRILDVQQCAQFFVFNATNTAYNTRSHEQPLQINCTKLLDIILKSQVKDVALKFRAKVLGYLKKLFFDSFIIKTPTKSSPGIVSFLAKIFEIELITYEDFKPFVEAVADRYATEDDSNIELCFEYIKTALEAKPQMDDFMEGFLELCDASKKNKERKEFKIELPEDQRKERKQLKREIQTKPILTSKVSKKSITSSIPYDHTKTFPAFKLAVEEVEYTFEEIDASKFNLQNIPTESLKEYAEFIVSLVISSSKPNFIIYLADICKEFSEDFQDKICEAASKKIALENEEEEDDDENESEVDKAKKVGSFLGLLYRNDVISVDKLLLQLDVVKDQEQCYEAILNMAREEMQKKDPKVFFEYADKIYESKKTLESNLKTFKVYPSFVELIKTIERDEELFLYKIRIDDFKESAECFFQQAVQEPELLDRFAKFLSDPPKEFQDASSIAFEVIAITISKFEKIEHNTKDPEKLLAAGSFLAELHNHGLVGFRTIEHIVLNLKKLKPKLSKEQNLCLPSILGRIQKNSYKDYAMKKHFKKPEIQRLVMLSKSFETDINVKLFNLYLKDHLKIKSKSKYDVVMKLLDKIERKDSNGIADAVINIAPEAMPQQFYDYLLSGMMMFVKRNYNKFFIEVLKEQAKSYPVGDAAAFMYILKEYYATTAERFTLENSQFRGFLVDLANNSILTPARILSCYEMYLKSFENFHEEKIKSLIFMMKGTNQEILFDEDEEAKKNLEAIQQDVSKRARASKDIKELVAYKELLTMVGINWMKPGRKIIRKEDREESKTERKTKNRVLQNQAAQVQVKKKEKKKKKKLALKKIIIKQPNVEVKPPKIKEISNFDVIGFKLLLNSLDLWPQSEQNEKIKNLKVETKTCIKIMAKEFLKEVTNQNFKGLVKVAAMIQENFPSFKKVLEKEIVKNLTKKLSEGFGNSNWIQISEEDFKVPEAEEVQIEEAEDEEPPVVESNKKKKKKMMRRKKKQVEVKVEEVEEEKAPTQAEIVEELKDAVNIFNLEASKVQNLINFAIELFNFDWISFENFKNFLQSFIESQNFKIASEVLKATSHKLSQHLKILNFDKILLQSASQSQNCYQAKVFEQLQIIRNSALENSTTMKVLESSLQNCELETFSLKFSKIENPELLVDQTLHTFVAKAILNDSKKFAKFVESFEPLTQKLLIKILLEKFKTFIEEENSTKLYEILGIFDFFASLLAIDIVKLLHFDEIFDFMMRQNSKFVKIFFETFGAHFEKLYQDNLKVYLRTVEVRLKLSRGSFAEVLREILELKERNWTKLDSSENLSKVEEILSKLSEENCQEISIKLQKLLRDDFKDFIETLWKFLLKNEKDSKLLLELCQQFKSSETLKAQLEEFLTYRRRTFLRIDIENFPENVRKKLKKVSSFIEKLAKFEILSQNHFEFWNEPHIKMRL